MKTRRKALSILLTMVLLLGLLPMSAAAEGSTNSAIMKGTAALSENVNKDSAQILYYGGSDRPYCVIGYDGTGAASESGTATLLAKNSFVEESFNSGGDNQYSGSTLQSAVDDLAEELSAAETNGVVKRTLAAGDYSGADTDVVRGTSVENAVLWPLSIKEATQVPIDLKELDVENTNWAMYYWWLRSPGYYDNYAAYVNGDGSVCISIGYNASDEYGVRPAFYLNLNSVLFTSAAEGGKISANPGGTAISEIPSYAGKEWKATLLDSARSFTATTTAIDGNVLTVAYSDAVTGNNEYISVLVADSTGAYTHYGRVAQLDGTTYGASGEVTIDLDMTGKTLYVFNEQYNGGENDDTKLTDYAGALQPVAEGCPVSFRANGHGTAPEAIMAWKGTTITAPTAPTEPGYTFEGWYREVECTNLWDFENDTVTEDTVLYAKWTPAPLTGAVTVSGTAKYGETLTATVSGDNNTGTLSYQWKRGGAEITGATGTTYTLTQDDIGSTNICAVTSTVQTGSIESAATAEVAKLDADYTPPAAKTGLTYDGSAQALVEAGSENVKYALGSQSEVTGTWSTEIPTGTNAGTYYVWYKVEADDTHSEMVAAAPIAITINKATPTGTPTCTAITSGGKTLADAVLAIGSITPAGGTLAWELPETTTVAANTNYAWTYTPADTANYNTLTGSVLLYSVSTGGGGGGGSVTPAPKEENVSVSGEVEVKVTVSGDTATVGEISAADIAKAAGTAEVPKAVQIDLTALNNREVSSVALSNKTLSNLAEAAKKESSGVSGVEIVLPGATVTLDAETLTAVQAQAEGKDITLTVNGKSTANLSAAQRDTVSGLTAPLVLDASFTANGRTISDFGGGMVSFTAPYSLPVGKTAADVKAYYLSPKGWLVPVASSYNEKTGEITVYAPHFSDYVISADGDPCAPFVDVNRNAWYHNAADFAIINGLMGGYSDNSFGPDDTLTRAQLVTILWRSEGAPVVNYTMDFADVPADIWYTEAVRWAAANGIVSGYGDGSFGPDDSITREQLATILCRYAAFKGESVSLDPDTNFLSWNDVFDISDWARDSLFWCIQSGILNGTGNGTLAPKGTATRAQTAQVLMKYLGK